MLNSDCLSGLLVVLNLGCPSGVPLASDVGFPLETAPVTLFLNISLMLHIFRFSTQFFHSH